MPAQHTGRRAAPNSHFGPRLAAFIAIVLLVAGTAAWLLRPQTSQVTAEDNRGHHGRLHPASAGDCRRQADHDPPGQPR
jgi:hypothetical protein